jgi:hypothetical protein
MIYKISAINMPLAFDKGGELITMSNDMIYGLMKNLNDVENISVEERYEDSEETTILSLPEWTKG